MARKSKRGSGKASVPSGAAPSGEPPGVKRCKPGRVAGKEYPPRETALSPQHMDPLWQSLDARIGGREGLLAAAVSSNNPKAQDLIPLLLDPAYKKYGTKALAKKAGLSASEVVDMYRDRKWLEGILAVHDQLPEVIQDAVVDAKASYVPCANCKGSKLDENGIKCWICSGKGEIRRPGDKDKLTFVGEAAGLTGKKGPLFQLNQQFNQQNNSPQSTFEDLMRKSTMSVGKPKQIEGESEHSDSKD